MRHQHTNISECRTFSACNERRTTRDERRKLRAKRAGLFRTAVLKHVMIIPGLLSLGLCWMTPSVCAFIHEDVSPKTIIEEREKMQEQFRAVPENISQISYEEHVRRKQNELVQQKVIADARRVIKTSESPINAVPVVEKKETPWMVTTGIPLICLVTVSIMVWRTYRKEGE